MQLPRISFVKGETIIHIPRSRIENQFSYKPGGCVAVADSEEDVFPIWEYRLIGKPIHDWRWFEVARISAEEKLATPPITDAITNPIELRPLLPDDCYKPIPFDGEVAQAA